MEILEDRLVCFGSALDEVVCLSQNGQDIVVQTFSPSYQIEITQNYSLDFRGGNDRIYNLTNLPLTINGGQGNDYVFGNGRGLILGGDGDDILLGNGGGTVQGGNGDDLVVAGWVDTNWAGTRSDRVIAALKANPTPAQAELDGGTGFNLVYDVSPHFTYQPTISRTLTSNGPDLQQIISSAQDGDTIYLQGDFYGDTTITKNLNLIGPATIHGRIKVLSSAYIENIHFDISGQNAYPEGYLNGFKGNVILNNIEVYGQNNTNVAALYFFNQNVISQPMILNSYVHDVFGDGISTGGYGSSTNVNLQSRLELFNIRGEHSGPAQNNQVLTAHAGFNVVDVLGNYKDAALNVVAPDNLTKIDMYWTHVLAGSRQGNVLLSLPTTLFGCTLLDQNRFVQLGTMEECYLEGKVSNIFIDSYGTIKKCYIKRITGNIPVRSFSGSVIDSVFEGWSSQILNQGATVEHNQYL